MHGSLKSHSSIIKQNVKFANFCHDQQWPSIFHYSLVAVSEQAVLLQSTETKGEKKPVVCHCCHHKATNTLNSRYCSLCTWAISDKGAVSATEYQAVVCHYITVPIGRVNDSVQMKTWAAKGTKKNKRLVWKKKMENMDVFFAISYKNVFSLFFKKKYFWIIGHTHFMPLRQLSFYFLWN